MQEAIEYLEYKIKVEEDRLTVLNEDIEDLRRQTNEKEQKRQKIELLVAQLRQAMSFIPSSNLPISQKLVYPASNWDMGGE